MAMKATWAKSEGLRKENSAVARANPAERRNRRTPRLKVDVKSGFRTIAIVMGSQ